MVGPFNVFQEVFLVAYAILYGVMLQNIASLKGPRTPTPRPLWEPDIAFQPFPWQQGAMKRRVQLVRLLCSVIVLNFLPFLYAVAILLLLQGFGSGESLGQWQFWTLIFFIFWSGLGVFGFQRGYGWLAWERRTRRYFWELYLLMKEQLGELGFQRKAAVVSIAFYIVVPFVLIVTWLNLF